MPKKKSTFRIGKVSAYQRGKVWYLCYHEHGRRRRPRVGPDNGGLHAISSLEAWQMLVNRAELPTQVLEQRPDGRKSSPKREKSERARHLESR